ncbi:MAG: DUF308 domain-containing protein [Bacilli bacterium]
MDKFLKWLGIFLGTTIIIIGGYAFLHPRMTILSITFYIAIALLIMGIFNIINYWQKRKEQLVSNWILVDGILGIILAIVLFSDKIIGTTAIPIFFGIFILLFGIQKIGLALDVKKLKAPYWKILMIIGIIAIVFSIITFIKPLIAAFAISVILGIILIFYGFMIIIASIYIDKIYKIFK